MPEAQGLRPRQGTKGAIWAYLQRLEDHFGAALVSLFGGQLHLLELQELVPQDLWDSKVGNGVGGAGRGRARPQKDIPMPVQGVLSTPPTPNHGMPPQPRREDHPAPKRRRLHPSQRGRWPRQELTQVDSHLDLLVAGRELPLLKGHRVVLDPLQKQADHPIVFLPAQLQLLSGACM